MTAGRRSITFPKNGIRVMMDLDKSAFVEMTTWASAVRPELFKLQESEV